MKIGNIPLPPNIKAILWDMDGVLIDSLEFDYNVCSALLSKYVGKDVIIPEQLIRRYFAYSHRPFWEGIVSELQETLTENQFNQLIEEYHEGRGKFSYALYPGVINTLEALKNQGITSVVVSSNETELIEEILANQKIKDFFKIVVGFDTDSPVHGGAMQKKPAPDMYQAALALLGLEPAEAIVIEDSIAGATAGHAAQCAVIGVSTGGASFEELSKYMEGKRGHVIRSLG